MTQSQTLVSNTAMVVFTPFFFGRLVVMQCPNQLGSGSAMQRRDFIRAIVGSRTKAGIIFCLLALFACQVALAAEPKRVLMLHSFGRDFKPWTDYASAIRSELERQSLWPLDIQDQSLVSARSSDEDPEVPFIEYLSALYRKKPPDIILGIGAPAAVFVQRHRPQLFPTTPMVFTGVDQRRVQYSNLTGNTLPSR